VWTLVRFLHLSAAAIWVGGQVALFLAVPPIRAFAANAREITATIGRRFGVVAGPALLVLLLTGIAQATHLDMWDRRQVREKLAILILILILTAVHGVIGQRIARGDERMRRAGRWISVVNLLLGFAAIWLAADLATSS
jgi:putative copper export protein